MAVGFLRTVGLLMTVFSLVLPLVGAEPSSNPEDGEDDEGQAQGYPPCNILDVDTEYPYVDFHPECITLPPDFP